MRTIRAAVLAGLFVVAVSCGGDTAPKWSSQGAWTGSVQGATLAVTLRDVDGEITGNGSLSGLGSAIALEANGTRADASVSMTLSANGYEPFNFSGTLTTHASIEGTLQGSGYAGEAITLVKVEAGAH